MIEHATSSGRRASRIGLAVVIALGLTSCTPSQPEATRIVTRLIPPSAFASSDAADFYDPIIVETWEFESRTDLAEWTAERIDISFGINEDGLVVESTSPDPSIVRSVELDADRIQAIRVTQSGLTSDAYMQFYWAPPDGPFSESRTIGCSTKDATGSLIPSFTFRVDDHPEWTGRVGSIRLDPTSIINSRQQIHSISAIEFVPSETKLTSVTTRPWRVDILGDVRTALLTPPEHPHHTTLDVPPNAQLRLATALDPDISQPVTFRLVSESDDSEESVLHQQTIEPCSPESPCVWHDATIDLGALAGQRVRLRFETESSAPLDLFEGFPAWSGLEVIGPAPANPGPNVLVIVIDTLRADRLSLSGYARPTSPNIDKWARSKGVIFDQVVAPAPWTLPSHASMFTGLDALSHGVNTGDPMPDDLTTMAEMLRDKGYATHAITGGAYLTDGYGVMQGFDSYRYFHTPLVDPSEVGNDIVTGIDDAIGWLQTATNRPFLLFFHTYEVHTPYRAREPFFSRFHDPKPGEPIPPIDTLPFEPLRENGYLMTAGLKARYDDPESGYRQIDDSHFGIANALYDSGVAFADLHIGRLLDELEALGLDEETVVVLTSDHGESLGERGKADHKSLEDWELLVPLIIASPDHSQTGNHHVERQVRLVDLLPTVFDLLHLTMPANLDGRSLVPLFSNPDAAHPDDAWSYASSSNSGLGLRRAGSLKYTFNNSAWRPIHGLESLYRIDVDPTTANDVADIDPQTNELRRESTATFEERTSGVRVRFDNRLDVPMEGHIKGHVVQPLRVKAFNLPADDIEWRYQMVNFTVPAGQKLDLFVEGVPFGELFVTARFDVPSDASTGFKKVLRLESMAGPWRTEFDGREWIESPDTDDGRHSAVRVWIHGDRAGHASAVAIDADSRALLRKLGYIR